MSPSLSDISTPWSSFKKLGWRLCFWCSYEIYHINNAWDMIRIQTFDLLNKEALNQTAGKKRHNSLMSPLKFSYFPNVFVRSINPVLNLQQQTTSIFVITVKHNPVFHYPFLRTSERKEEKCSPSPQAHLDWFKSHEIHKMEHRQRPAVFTLDAVFHYRLCTMVGKVRQPFHVL